MFAAVIVLVACAGCRGRKSATENYFYDRDGRLSWYRSADGVKSQFAYDASGQLTSVTGPGGSTRFGYDAHRNRIWTRDAKGSDQYFYDAFDRLRAEVTRRSPARLNTYEYDWNNRVRSVEIVDLELLANVPDFADRARRLAASGAEDSAGWPERERMALDLAAEIRGRPDAERRQWVLYESRYRYDLAGRVTTLASDWGAVRYQYQPDGRKADRVLPNGVRSSFTFQPDGRLSALRHESSGGTLLAEFRYQYNRAGEVIHSESDPPGLSGATPAEPADRSAGVLRDSPWTGNAAHPVNYYYTDGLLAVRPKGDAVRFLLEDGFGNPALSVDQSGTVGPVPEHLPGPSLRAAPQAAAGVDVFVAGICTTSDDLAGVRGKTGVETISTSILGKPSWATPLLSAVDLSRAAAN
ncbi:MAG: hypothetical protein NTY38_05610 [Acidobacteria bacterium]|nr:hypothetical protein [Acidobacteriota bacterium]